MTRLRTLALACALVIGAGALAACGGGGDDGGGGGGGGAASGDCPIGAIDEARADGGDKVEMTMWHSMTRENETTLQGLADAFNSAQDDVEVKLVNQPSYDETNEKFRAGLTSGDLPDLIQMEDIFTQQMIDSQSVLPAQACVDAENYDMSDFLPRVVDYYTVEDTLWPMPFNVSNPVLYYNKNAFADAGLDPEAPPTSLDELRAASESIKAAGYEYGLALKVEGWYLEQWFAKAGEQYVDNGNGRDARATAVDFDNETGLEIFEFLSDMVADGLAVTNERIGAGAIDNYLAVANGKAAMTIDTSAALGTIDALLSGGQFPNVSLGVGDMPGPEGEGGVLVGGGALYILNDSSPEKQEAAWRFAQFLNEPENMAAWAAGTGYIPIRESSVDEPVLQQRYAELPELKVAYDQLLAGENNLATAGPVIGDYRGVRDVVEEAENQMFIEGKDPQDALTDAKNEADSVIADYNDRLGV
jgi:sn-glycerol 3-phosphate transport system substrate-binding protein